MTVSTAGFFIRRTTFGAAFFTVARLGLALATVRFVGFPRADLATLRAFPRLAEFPLGSFPRFCTFDPFLRLAMIDPPGLVRAPMLDQKTTGQVRATYQTSYHQISA
jgi:hypothetical protein